MTPFGSVPIFYDTQRRRSRYSRRAFFSISIFLVTIFGVLLGSMVVRPWLPTIALAEPDAVYRGGPNVPRSSSVIRQPQSLDLRELRVPAPRTVSPTPPPMAVGFYVNWDDNSLTSLKENIQTLDLLIPEWLHLANDSGAIMVDDEARQQETLAVIHALRPNLAIMPLINNFNGDIQDWDDEMLQNMLEDPEARTTLIGNILTYVQENSFAGVSIDFESVPPLAQKNLILFMRELYARFHPLGLEVSQNIPLEDPGFSAKVLGAVNDFLILMAYDEHSIYDGPAGPISSQGWFWRELNNRFRELPIEKYVIALGGYGYDWLAASANGSEKTFEEAMRTAHSAGTGVGLDPVSLNPTYSYTESTGQAHTVWFLDAVSTFNARVMTEKLGKPRGYALWRLGSEDPGVWGVLGAAGPLDEVASEQLKSLRYGYDVSYEGKGEVLQVTATPRIGSRSLRYDTSSGLILEEEITDFPSPFVITRWGGRDPKKIALTFDDGPDVTYTPQILDILKKYHVPATFFIVGVNGSVHPELLQRIVQEGSEVGNHTYTHPNITRISKAQFQIELDTTERLFEGVLGRKALLFRPPYAEDVEPAVPEQVAPLLATNEFGYYTVGMHIDPSDWNEPGTDEIVKSVLDGATAGLGNVVLLHDGGGVRTQTVEALPRIIEGLERAGFELVSVSDLMHVPPEAVMPPISAREKFLTWINGLGFYIISGATRFLSTMFTLGIILGLCRFLFLSCLALAQWAYLHLGRYRQYTADFHPSVTVVIPAFNEEKVIVRTVEAILASEYTPLDITVVDDGSTDKTLSRLNAAFASHTRVRILSQHNTGKAGALNRGIALSSAEIVVTLDADTLFRPDTVSRLIRRFVDRRVAAAAGNAKVGNRINLLTRWQALEYITSQNLDRRAFEIINCIAVVPGAVGAWRREAVLAAGGFSSQTLAEDADLTFALLRRGHLVAYDDEAIAFTEAPATLNAFVKQRFRWMFGTLQTAWKHRDTLGRLRYGTLGIFALPNVFIFQVFFPLISPLMDLTVILSLLWAGWQKYSHPIDVSAGTGLQSLLLYYGLFLLVDFFAALLPFCLERREEWSLLIWLPLQRFFYRQLLYYVAIKATVAAVRGKMAHWGTLERKATSRLLPVS